MATKGSVAKERVKNTIQEAFGADYIGEFNKKYYVWANDSSGRVQIAISLTCPKENIDIPTAGGDHVFEDDLPATASSQPTGTFEPAPITPEEDALLEEMIKKLGL